jgi:hypothetical protein
MAFSLLGAFQRPRGEGRGETHPHARMRCRLALGIMKEYLQEQAGWPIDQVEAGWEAGLRDVRISIIGGFGRAHVPIFLGHDGASVAKEAERLGQLLDGFNKMYPNLLPYRWV